MVRDRGFALLIVLWSLVLLSLIMTHILSSGRTEAQLAGNLRNAAVAEAAANGAIQEAVFHLLSAGPGSWPRRGSHDIQIGRAAIRVTIEDLSDEVNPNNASERLLRALFGLCGANAAQTLQLARAVLIWRGDPDQDASVVPAPYSAAHLPYLPPGQAIQSLEEMSLVVGMTKPLLACVQPHLSLFQDEIPGRQSDDRLVARAAAIAEQDGDVAGRPTDDPTGALRITAEAEALGARFTRQATVRLTKGGDDGRLFRILTWETP